MRFKHITWLVFVLASLMLVGFSLWYIRPYMPLIAQELAISAMILIAVGTLGIIGMVGLLAWWIVVEIQGRQIKHRRFVPSAEGNYDAYLTAQETFAQPVVGNFAPPVPHSLHYAPHLQLPRGRDTQEEEDEERASEGEPQVTLTPLEQFYDLIPYNSLQVAMGTELTTGKPVLAEILKSTHFKVIGGSDTGKSCLAAAMLDVATNTNDTNHLQIGLLDMEWKTAQLFQHVPHIAEIGPRRIRLVAHTAEEVAQKLRLLEWEMNRRAKLSEVELEQEPVLLVYVEEMMALKWEVEDEELKKQMLAAINHLGARCRKYRIYLLSCMQIDYSDKSTREGMAQYRTRAGFALDPDAAKASGFHSRELVKANYRESRQGQYILEKPQYSGVVLSPFYDVKARLARIGMVMASTSPAPSPRSARPFIYQVETPVYEVESDLYEAAPEGAPEAATSQPLHAAPQAASLALSEQEKRILRKFTAGSMNINAIVQSEFTNASGEPLKGGKLYQDKCNEVADLIRRVLPQFEEA